MPTARNWLIISRVFVADTPDGLEIWPIGVGKSKLIDDPQRVIRKIFETFPRIAAGLRAGNLDASRPVRVRWGHSRGRDRDVPQWHSPRELHPYSKQACAGR